MPAGVVVAVEGSATHPRVAHVDVVRDGKNVAHRAFDPGPEHCNDLHAAVALAIALAVKAPARSDAPPPRPDDTRSYTRHWSIGMAGVFAYRLLPKPSPGLELSATRGLTPHLQVRMGAVGTVAFDIPLEDEAGAFDAALVAARIDACVRAPRAAPLEVDFCLGVLGGVLRAAGRDVEAPTRDLAGWLALTGGAGLGVALRPRWSLRLEAALVTLLTPLRVGLEGADGTPVAARPADRLGFLVSLGPTFRF